MTGGRVFGMGSDPTAEPDWPPLTLAEIGEVISDAAVALEWRSPRPLSSTAGVRLAVGSRVVVKRMPIALRDAAALAEEHAFMAHLRSRGIPIPAVSSCTRGEFSYEIHALGAGVDLYRDAFSWSPYLSVTQAAAAGRMLARLHRAAEGYDAPVRPPRPLQAGMCTDLVATIERRCVEWPAVGDFLAAHEWREEVDREGSVRGGAGPLHVDVAELSPLWTHNDWHGTNLLWTGDEVTAVIDFGLANRTAAVFDLATAIERFAVDWLSLRGGGPAHIHADQLAAFLRAYRESRPLTAAERRALPALFPLVHVDYELSEIDYFLTVLPRPNHENAEIAYREYLLGHVRWAGSAAGRDFLDLLSYLCAE
ncbi:phosphotransferase enzyme family protein [Nocardia thraciensis]